METHKRPLEVRRGVTVGLIMLAVLTPVVVANSSTPLLALIETLAFGLIGVFGVGAVAVAVNRRRSPPEDVGARRR